jgi:hypothetical protein
MQHWPQAPVDLDAEEEEGEDGDEEAYDDIHNQRRQDGPASGAGADDDDAPEYSEIVDWGEPDHDVSFMDAAFHDYDPEEGVPVVLHGEEEDEEEDG